MSNTQFFVVSSSGKAVIEKDPDAELDYTFFWAGWLAVGETIDSHNTVIESGSGEVFSSVIRQAGTCVTAWVRGGQVGEKMTLRCRIGTSAGRVDDRSVFIKIKQR